MEPETTATAAAPTRPKKTKPGVRVFLPNGFRCKINGIVVELDEKTDLRLVEATTLDHAAEFAVIGELPILDQLQHADDEKGVNVRYGAFGERFETKFEDTLPEDQAADTSDASGAETDGGAEATEINEATESNEADTESVELDGSTSGETATSESETSDEAEATEVVETAKPSKRKK